MARDAHQPDSLVAVKIDGYEAPCVVDGGTREAFRARYETLLVDPTAPPSVGGSGMVVPALNGDGEKIALKKLLLPQRAAGQPEEDHERRRARKRAAFRSEYDMLVRLSPLRRFPTALGFGSVDGEPVILMEWLEGVSLEELLQAEGRFAERSLYRCYDVALIAKSLFGLIDSMAEFGEGFVHRDLSPANIIVRTADRPLEEQIAARELDLCLIDFGSSVIDLPQSGGPAGAGASASASSLRGTTPEYAPPEMLSDGFSDVDRLRASQKVDVYAACSILYEMLTGLTPFELHKRPECDPAQVKIDESPEFPDPLEKTRSEAMALASVFMHGLVADPERRPDAATMKRAIGRWLRVHDRYGLPDEGSPDYPITVDTSLFLPEHAQAVTFGLGMARTATQLDAEEDFGQRPDAHEAEREPNALAKALDAMTGGSWAVKFAVALVLFSILMVYVGHGLHPIVQGAL